MDNIKPSSRQIVEAGSAFVPPEPLPDETIRMIHAGLLIPSAASILSMSREIRKWRGDPHPDSI